IEMRRILVAEEEAHVSVRIVLDRALDPGLEDDVGHVQVFDKREVQWATMRRGVLTLAKLAIDLSPLGLHHFPGIPVGRLPMVCTFGEVIAEEQRRVLHAFICLTQHRQAYEYDDSGEDYSHGYSKLRTLNNPPWAFQ